MKLIDGNVDESYVIRGIELELPIKRRLEALGMTQGADILMLKKKECGAVIFKVRGTRLAVGKSIAQGIIIDGRQKKWGEYYRSDL